MRKTARRAMVLVGLISLVATSFVPTPASGSDVTFGPVVIVSAGDDEAAAEPSIRAARDGTLYIAAPTGLGGARINESDTCSRSCGDIIWRSDDGGRTWQFLGNYDPAAGGGDADIAPDRNGVLWASGLSLANTTVGISTDRGDNFNINPVGVLETVVDRQWIETYKAEPFAFLTTGQFTDRRIIMSRIERVPGDYPVVSNTVTLSGDHDYQWPGEIAVDETNGLVYVSYNTAGEKQDKIVVSRTDLNLAGLQRNVVTTTRGDSFDSFVGLDTDSAGNVYVVWTERRPQGEEGRYGRTHTMLSVSRDKGKTWSTPLKINSYPRTTVFPWVVAGSQGRIAVAYYGIRHLGASPESVVYPGRRIPRWKVWLSYSLNAHLPGRDFAEVRAAPFLHKGNVCTSGTGCAAGTRDLLDYFQLDLDPCGRIVIAYTDNSRDQVTSTGERPANNPEYVAFVGQNGGPRFYATPLNPDAC